jgi:4'-phosphopantetheinyl transferase
VTSGEVHFWSAPLDGLPRAQIDLAERVLSSDEQARAERMSAPQHRRRWITSRFVLRDILARYCGGPPQAITFRYGPNGKPEVVTDQSGGPVHFSVSHSQGLAVYAVAAEPLGVDLERHRPLPVEDLASRFLSDYEAAAVARAEGVDQLELFITCWTRKEAYLKAVGVGLSAPLQDFDVDLDRAATRALVAHRGDAREPDRWSLLVPAVNPGFQAAIVVSRSPWALRRFDWENPQ